MPDDPETGGTSAAVVFLRSLVPNLVASAIVVVAFVALFALNERFGWSVLGQKTQVQAPEVASGEAQQTELLFLNGLKSMPASDSEWWSARSDHRLVAYAIFNCKQMTDLTLDAMPREYFGALLLDLTPDGGHVFRVKDNTIRTADAADKSKAAAVQAKAIEPARKVTALSLTGTDQDLLSLSDSIARARIAAADGASVNVPWAQRLGIAALIVGALATLFVTLQGKMKPVEYKENEKEEIERRKWGRRFAFLLWGPGAGFRWVAFWAITLSITTTALTGLKQVYDPTRILTQNTRSLLELRQLHQDIVLGFRCDDEKKKIMEPTRLALWTETLRRIRSTITPQYGAYATPDVNGQRNELNSQKDLTGEKDTRGRQPSPETGSKQGQTARDGAAGGASPAKAAAQTPASADGAPAAAGTPGK